MRNLKRALVVLPAVAALTLLGGAAQAFDWDSIGWDSGANSDGSRTYFAPYGEHFYILDNNSDGHSAVGEVEYGDRHLTYWNPDGVNSTRAVNLTIAEGTYVRYDACYGEYKGYKISACGYWVGATA
ncbi:hypothetical protein G3I40_45075 [Streptomyces sp. SID14478]|uniref:hypothetical protein n=1 Tax=Streptomyces sp. SID14478 TaxID=2706073 RepID=UPI0013DECE29|nr:hypothetical protein [Streptomyces sp. SID14478]NEB82335.1 hypothetical protein [Streptomyces sp. SID14478]